MVERYSLIICASLSSVEAIVSDTDCIFFLLDSIWAWVSAREPAVGGSGRCILMLLDVGRTLCRGQMMLGGKREGEGAVRGNEAVVLKGASAQSLILAVHNGPGPNTCFFLFSDPSFQRQGEKKRIIIYMQSML